MGIESRKYLDRLDATKRGLMDDLKFERKYLRNLIKAKHPNDHVLEAQHHAINEIKDQLRALSVVFRPSKYE